MHFQRSRFLPWISAACLGAALLAGAAWAGTAEGVRAYDRGQFALAAKELQPAAQAGDPEAQFHLGLMHDFGKGVQLDHAKAAALCLQPFDDENLPDFIATADRVRTVMMRAAA